MSTLVSSLGWSLRVAGEELDQGQVHFAAHQSAIADEVAHKERPDRKTGINNLPGDRFWMRVVKFDPYTLPSLR